MSIHLPEEITSGYTIRPESIHELGNAVLMIAGDAEEKKLLILAPTARMMPEGFSGEMTPLCNKILLSCPCSPANAAALRRHFPWTKPVGLRKIRTTISINEPAITAGSSLLNTVRKFQASPVLTLQSKQNLELAGKTFQNTVDDAVFQVFETNFRSGWGAGAASLKSMEDVDSALEAGMTMFSLDLSCTTNTAAAELDEDAINAAFAGMDEKLRTRIEAEYAGQTFINGDCGILIDQTMARRCAVMYAPVIDFAEKIHQHLAKRKGEDFDLELSLTGAALPTLPEQHFFLMREIRRRNITISSLALRFTSNQELFSSQFHCHVQIARANGNYKITIPAVENYSEYAAVSRETDRRLHLKIANKQPAACPDDLEKYVTELLYQLAVPLK